MVDSTLDLGNGGGSTAAISSTSNMLYMRNVQLRGFRAISHFNRSRAELPLPTSFVPHK